MVAFIVPRGRSTSASSASERSPFRALARTCKRSRGPATIPAAGTATSVVHSASSRPLSNAPCARSPVRPFQVKTASRTEMRRTITRAVSQSAPTLSTRSDQAQRSSANVKLYLDQYNLGRE
jgi:hypothetical protein